MGLTDRLPRLIGVQPEGCSPIVAAFNQGQEKITPVERPDTICSAVAAGDPLDGPKALRAIRESGGCALSMSDGEILEAQQLLARLESIFAAPAGGPPTAPFQPLPPTPPGPAGAGGGRVFPRAR